MDYEEEGTEQKKKGYISINFLSERFKVRETQFVW
jgi:hypothetical protein